MGKPEKGYTDVEQLMFALIFAVRKFRPYLLMRPFVVLTAEQNFPFVIKHMHLSARISKWVVELQEFEYSFTVEESTRASLADVLTYRHREKKFILNKEHKETEVDMPTPLVDAFTLFFDGAYRKKTGVAAGGIVILDPSEEIVLKEGRVFQDIQSNNEAEYAALRLGLELCLERSIKKLVVKGDSLLIIKQVKGVWECKSENLVGWWKQIKELIEKFEETHIQHIPRESNSEADLLANQSLEGMVVGAIKFQELEMEGVEDL